MRYILLFFVVLFSIQVEARSFFSEDEYLQMNRELQNQEPFDAKELYKLIYTLPEFLESGGVLTEPKLVFAKAYQVFPSTKVLQFSFIKGIYFMVGAKALGSAANSTLVNTHLLVICW